MAKKAAPPTTPTPPAAADRELRSRRTTLRRSPRFHSPSLNDCAFLSLPYPLRSRTKTTKKPPQRQSETLSTKEKQVRRSGSNFPTPSDSSRRRSLRLAHMDLQKSPESCPRRSPRLVHRNLQTPPDSSRHRPPRFRPAVAAAVSPNRKKSLASRSVEAPQDLRRSPRLAVIYATHVDESPVLDSREAGKEAKTIPAKKEGQQKEIREVDASVRETKGITRGESAHCCGPGDWTEEQEKALRRAYLLARPSPHFWKRVSKMVPGKSAHECFNKIHADLATPPQHQPRSRAKKANFSPMGNLTFSDKPVEDMKMQVRKTRSGKRKSLAALKTVRHLLNKHRLADQTQETDCFLVLEDAASPLELPVSSPGTPDYSSGTPVFLLKCSEMSSSGHVKFLSRFNTSSTDPSPEVLKPIKNTTLHERYIDHLHSVDARRPGSLKTTNFIADPHVTENKMQKKDLKASRLALITGAIQAIGHYRHMQANALNYDTDGTTSGNHSADSDNDDDCDIVRGNHF